MKMHVKLRLERQIFAFVACFSILLKAKSKKQKAKSKKQKASQLLFSFYHAPSLASKREGGACRYAVC